MGTNYYVDGPTPCCPTCGRRSEVHHIGKSSMGWSFSFRGYREDAHLTSAKEWFAYLADKKIIDEYGRSHSLEEFRAMVDGKRTERVGPIDDRKVLDADGYVINFYEFS